MRQICRSWLPVVVWMVLIIGGSTDALSSRQTSRFLVPFLRWLAPGMSQAALDRWQYGVRKGGHVFEYAGLALLIWRARRRQTGPRPDRGWSWPDARRAWVLAAGFAITDEIHQSFTSSRFGSAADVGIDGAGAVLGLGLVWLWLRWRTPGRQPAPLSQSFPERGHSGPPEGGASGKSGHEWPRS